MALNRTRKQALTIFAILGCAMLVSLPSYAAKTAAVQPEDQSSFEVSDAPYVPASSRAQEGGEVLSRASIRGDVVGDPVIAVSQPYTISAPTKAQPANNASGDAQTYAQYQPAAGGVIGEPVSDYSQTSARAAPQAAPQAAYQAQPTQPDQYSRDYAARQMAQIPQTTNAQPTAMNSGEQFSVASENEAPPIGAQAAAQQQGGQSATSLQAPFQPVANIEPAAGHQGYSQPMAPTDRPVLNISNSATAGAPTSARFVVESWRARKGESVQSVLKRWADRQSVALMWSSAETPFLQEDFSFVGTFQDAVNHLLKNVKNTDLHPEIRSREGEMVKNPVYTPQPDNTIRQIRPAPNADVMTNAQTMPYGGGYEPYQPQNATSITPVSRGPVNSYNGVQPASGADSIY